jgi:Peptidase C39 family
MIVPHFFQSSEQTCGAACLRMLGAACGVAQDEATIARACGTTALGCTVADLAVGAHAMSLQAEILPVFGWPEAIEGARASGPLHRHDRCGEFVRYHSYVSVAFCGTPRAPKRYGVVS